MRILVFFTVSVLSHYLAARWLLAVSPWARARARKIYVVAGSAAFVLSTLRFAGGRVPSPFLHDVTAVAMLELAIVTLTLLPLGVLFVIARGAEKAMLVARPPANDEAKAVRMGRREAIERTVGFAVAGVTTSTIGWGFVRGRHGFAIEEVVIKVPNWPKALEGYTIAQVSDVHVGTFVTERELGEGFELVRKIRPDLVVATGDLVDIDANEVRALLAHLADVGARDGAFTILGNHDHYAGPAQVAALIRDSKVKLLDNESIRLREHDGGGFTLVGVDDIQGRGHAVDDLFRGPDLGKALRTAHPDLPRILLAHQPAYFHESQARVALQLSGHTHGGQINPGFRPAAAVMEFVAGKYERAGSTLYVNRGFGVSGPPSRVGAPPEVTKIVIVSG